VHCISSYSRTILSSVHVSYTVHARIHVTEGHICGGRVCSSLPAAFGRCKHIKSFLVCLPLGCPLGWPAGVSSILSMGEQPPSVWQTRGPHKVLTMCSRLLGRLPSDETPGVSSLGCALVAVRACLLVLLCCVHPTTFLTPYLPYPTVVPSVRYTSFTFSCL
jgi:hypothetical protein